MPVCPACQGKEMDTSNSQIVCVNCGTIVEASSIVSAVEFKEGRGGSRFVPLARRVVPGMRVACVRTCACACACACK